MILKSFLPILVAVYGMLLLGYAARRAGCVRLEFSRIFLRHVVQYIEPAVVWLVMWNLDLTRPGRLIALPLFGLAIAAAMFVPGWAASKLFRLEGPRRGAFVACAMMSNMGLTMGTFVCYLFLGDEGAALGIAWCLYFLPFTVSVVFNLARYYGSGARPTFGQTVREYLSSPIARNINVGLLGGLLFSVIGVPKFAGFQYAHSGGIYLDAIACSLGIGMGLHVGRSVRYLRESLAMCGLKFVVCPLIGVGIYMLVRVVFPLEVLDSAVFAVLLIQSSMPVAIFSIVVAALFELDRDLANACWIMTTAASLPVVAALFFITRRILAGS